MIDIPGVDRVLDHLYISGARAGFRAPLLRKAGIKRVLKLYFYDPYWPQDFTVCDNAVEDGMPVPSDMLRYGVDFIRQGIDAGEPVLVCCRAGISRSSTFILAYLLESGHDLHDAWQLLLSRHPEAWPALELWASLLVHYDLPYSIDDVFEWLRDGWEPGGLDLPPAG